MVNNAISVEQAFMFLDGMSESIKATKGPELKPYIDYILIHIYDEIRVALKKNQCNWAIPTELGRYLCSISNDKSLFSVFLQEEMKKYSEVEIRYVLSEVLRDLEENGFIVRKSTDVWESRKSFEINIFMPRKFISEKLKEKKQVLPNALSAYHALEFLEAMRAEIRETKGRELQPYIDDILSHIYAKIGTALENCECWVLPKEGATRLCIIGNEKLFPLVHGTKGMEKYNEREREYILNEVMQNIEDNRFIVRRDNLSAAVMHICLPNRLK